MTAVQNMSVSVKFGIKGNLRFLSHAETIRLCERACVRAGIKMVYSQGFNPHPKLSLPLPRTVGVESDDDLLYLRIQGQEESFDEQMFKVRLGEQLPAECEVLSVNLAHTKTVPQPCLAMYTLAIQRQFVNDRLRADIKRVLESESLDIRRQVGGRGCNFKNINVRGFLQSIKLEETTITVECKVGPDGSIRVDEILELLGLSTEMLAAPIRRSGVQWVMNES